MTEGSGSSSLALKDSRSAPLVTEQELLAWKSGDSPVLELGPQIAEGGTALIHPVMGRPAKVAKILKGPRGYSLDTALEITNSGRLLHRIFPERSVQVDGPVRTGKGLAVQMDRLPTDLIPIFKDGNVVRSHRVSAKTVDQINEIFARLKAEHVAITDPNFEADGEGKIWLFDPDSVVKMDLADPRFQLERFRGPYGPKVEDWEFLMEKIHQDLVTRLQDYLNE